MTTQNLPGTDAARHGTGDADLTIMLAAHDAFRRDLTRLVRAAAAADLSDPARRRSVAAGWELFKHELHLHHTAEDEVIWPVLRPRLAHSEHALSVLDAMEEEHERIDPLLAAVDAAFAQRPAPGAECDGTVVAAGGQAGRDHVAGQPGGGRAVELQPVGQVGLVGLPARLAADRVEPLQAEPDRVAGPRPGQDAGQQPGQRGLGLPHRLPDQRQRAGVFPRSGHDDDPLVVVNRTLRRNSRRCCDRVEPDYI